MRLFNASPFSRWTLWVASSTARRPLPQNRWANAHPPPTSQGARWRTSVPGSQKQRPRVSIVRNWFHERGQHEGKAYPCNITIHPPANRVWLGYVVIKLPRHWRFRDDRLDVFIEFSPPGTRHPRCFAALAAPGDPACRLALRVRGDRLDHGEFSDYVHSTGQANVFKANALTDFLLDTAPREEIMSRPRRVWEPRKPTPSRE